MHKSSKLLRPRKPLFRKYYVRGGRHRFEMCKTILRWAGCPYLQAGGDFDVCNAILASQIKKIPQYNTGIRMMITAARQNSRSRKSTPLACLDDMANTWGSTYVGSVNGEMATRVKLETLFRYSAVPGFLLGDVVESGSSANERAMSIATNGNFSLCLIGLGSYVGGAGSLELLSTIKAESNWTLGLIREPVVCTPTTQTQTIPLPYHVAHSQLDDSELQSLETRCLQLLHTKLAYAALQGVPYKAFLLEYILSGNGGELTVRFLEQLANLLGKYKIVLIVDEIMTGARIGSTVAMTSTMPANVINCIGYITLGKVFGCGLVLVKQKAMDVPAYAMRGTTTELELNEPFWNLQHILDQLKRGVIESKRRRVLNKLNLPDPNQIWGRGLLMFCSKQRSHITSNLRNRLLPTLEDNPKTKFVSGFSMTHWNRVTVNDHLCSRINAWLQYSSAIYEKLNVSPYTLALSNYISRQAPIDSLSSTPIYPQTLVDFIDLNGSNQETMIAEHNVRKKRKYGSVDGRSSAGHKNLVHGSLREAAEKSNGFLCRNRKHKKRKVCFVLDFDTLS